MVSAKLRVDGLAPGAAVNLSWLAVSINKHELLGRIGGPAIGRKTVTLSGSGTARQVSYPVVG
jgi:hypothetical protein